MPFSLTKARLKAESLERQVGRGRSFWTTEEGIAIATFIVEQRSYEKESLTYQQIASLLNDEGATTPTGRPWTSQGVVNVHNMVKRGEIAVEATSSSKKTKK